MKIVLAFDSFKECMSATNACLAAEQGILMANPSIDVISLPLSDGGEGLVECVERILPLKEVSCRAHSPLLVDMEASYAISADGCTAYMEMASTSGLALVPPHKRNPLYASTYGVGDMMADAMRRGCSHIVMGIGGSATCDGGRGMLDSLRDKDISFESVPQITVACDVTNPLYGSDGAAYVFGPQKGADPEEVSELDWRLRNFALDLERRGLATPEMANIPGAGAAGGLGYGLIACLHASLKRGVDVMFDIADFDAVIADADLVITGEGKSDAQTLMGKVPQGVLDRCLHYGVPCHLLSGIIEDKEKLMAAGFSSVASINDGDNRPLDVLMHGSVAKGNMITAAQRLLDRL